MRFYIYFAVHEAKNNYVVIREFMSICHEKFPAYLELLQFAYFVIYVRPPTVLRLKELYVTEGFLEIKVAIFFSLSFVIRFNLPQS